MSDRPRSLSSGTVAAGVVDVVLAEARLLAKRDLTDDETARLRHQLGRLRLIEERRASEQLDLLATTIATHRERIEQLTRELAEALASRVAQRTET